MSGKSGRRWAIFALTLQIAALALPIPPASAGGRTAASPPYPEIADTSHASPRAVSILRGLYIAKSRHDGAGFMSHFADDMWHGDATVSSVKGRATLTSTMQAAFRRASPVDAAAYPVKIVGDERSAVVLAVNRPGLFGREVRVIASVTFNRKGKIVRWVDYWSDYHDPRARLFPGYSGAEASIDYRDALINASPKIQQVAMALQRALADGDPAAAAALFSADAVYEDAAAHTIQNGRLQIQRYLARSLATLPYGVGASVAHVVGSDQGGGYEWRAAPSGAPLKRGITAIELDSAGKITRLTTLYDAGRLSYPQYQALVLLGAESAN